MPATETSFRGAGYALAAEVTPEQAIFGAAPQGTVRMDGQTSRPPEARDQPGGFRFPPDSLREVSYWDQARQGTSKSVLCVLAEPPVLRTLLGPDDDLPEAVRLIRTWTESGGGSSDDVEGRLSSPEGAPTICYVAGFELRLRTTTDLPGLVRQFLRFPGRPGAAARGIMSLVHLRTVQISDSEVTALARRLLDLLAHEPDPEALVAYLTWFDAHRERIATDPGLVATLRREAKRVAEREFDGSDAGAWSAEVDRVAQSLSEGF